MKTFSQDNNTELKRLRDILIATLDYQIDGYLKSERKFEGFNPIEHLRDIKKQTEELYKNGKETKLKYWLRDFTEIPRETRDFNFVIYIKQKTGYDYNIFTAFINRIEKIITRGKITSENQFREVNSIVDFLCKSEPTDKKKISTLNNLLVDFENRVSKKKVKR